MNTFTKVTIAAGVIWMLFAMRAIMEGSITEKDIEPKLWVDPENNCQYLVVPGGITPRNNINQTQVCKALPVGRE